MRPKILIVEDEPVTRELYRSLLEPIADVVEAADGYEALTAVRRYYFSLVFLDINMPGLSGHQVATALRKDPHARDAPIVFVTGQADAAGPGAEADYGLADLVLVKPVDAGQFRSLARLLLRLYTAQGELRQQLDLQRVELRDLRAQVAAAVGGPRRTPLR